MGWNRVWIGRADPNRISGLLSAHANILSKVKVLSKILKSSMANMFIESYISALTSTLLWLYKSLLKSKYNTRHCYKIRNITKTNIRLQPYVVNNQ